MKLTLIEALAALSNNTFTPIDLREQNIDALGAHAIAEAITVNKTLICIDLSWNNIGPDEGAQAIAVALTKNKTLKSIYLRHNNMGTMGAKLMAQTLKVNDTLTFIDLSHNNIDFMGVQSLLSALKTNKTLTSINISYNKIDALGVVSLRNIIATNKTLTSIDLSGMNISSIHLEFIEKALKANQTLASIQFRDNNIGYSGAKTIASILKANNTLTAIDLSHNNIDNQGTIALINALKENHTLTSINLDGNPIAVGMLSAIYEQVELNKKTSALSLLNSVGLDYLRCHGEILESFIIEANGNDLLEKFKNNKPDQISQMVIEVLDKCILATSAPNNTINAAQKAYEKLSIIQDENLKPEAQLLIEDLGKTLQRIGPLFFSEKLQAIQKERKSYYDCKKNS